MTELQIAKDSIFELEMRNRRLDRAIHFAAGFMSADKMFKDKHPQDVYDWIMKQTDHETAIAAVAKGDE